MINVELFEGLNPSMILADVMEQLTGCLGSLHESEFQLNTLCFVGSRLKGTHREDSDLDIALSYKGTLREDDCYNMLNDEECPLYIEGIKVDFIPYSLEKGHDIDFSNRHYILQVEESEDEEDLYVEEKMKRLVAKDCLLGFVYRDLTTKRNLPSCEALVVIFNGYVLDDFDMITEYKNA